MIWLERFYMYNVLMPFAHFVNLLSVNGKRSRVFFGWIGCEHFDIFFFPQTQDKGRYCWFICMGRIYFLKSNRSFIILIESKVSLSFHFWIILWTIYFLMTIYLRILWFQAYWIWILQFFCFNSFPYYLASSTVSSILFFSLRLVLFNSWKSEKIFEWQ